MANHYIRRDATGNNTGEDWTNAWTQLPSTLFRGDTYYIAGGIYPNFYIEPISGTSLITIRKATISDHGTYIGWSDSYGIEQAIFKINNVSPARIRTSYILFDGVEGDGATTGLNGAGSNPDNYGFKFQHNDPNNINTAQSLLDCPYASESNVDFYDITISHVAFVSAGRDYETAQVGLYSYPKSGNFILTYNYFIGGTSNLLTRNWSNGSKVQYNYFDYNHAGTPSCQQWSSGYDDDLIVSNNIFRDSTTYAIGTHGGTGLSAYNWKVYNNLFVGGNATVGSADTRYSNVIINWDVHGNTFINCSFVTEFGVLFAGTLTDVDTMKSNAYNNLIYNCSYPRFDNGIHTANAIIHTHNAHFNSSGVYDKNEGGTAMDVMGDPFINSINKDYHLKYPTLSGKILPPPFDIDTDGNIRGADGVWDRGAYEYTSECPTPIVTFNLNT